MARTTIYLDHQATTPALPEVVDAMVPWLRGAGGVPGSFHAGGLRARAALATARGQLAALLDADPEEISFTSGGTEALNLAVKGTAYAHQRRGRHLVAAATESLAVLQSIEFLETQGWSCTRVPVDGVGRVDPEAVAAALRDDTVLVCVQHANLEIGTLQPVAEVGRRVAVRGVPLLVDATASGGWLPLDVRAWGASLVVLSPHRFHGPPGVGVLFRQRQARLHPLQHGGGQEGGRRAGTENLPAIIGAGVAAEIAARELPARQAHTADLQARLWAGVQARIPHVQLNGPPPGPARLPMNLNVSFECVEGEGLVLRLDLQGIATATGPACLGQGAAFSSPVLRAIGLDRELAQGSLVFSLGRGNTAAELETTLAALESAVARLRSLSPGWEELQRGAVAARTPLHPPG